MATHSSILTWRTPWTVEPGGSQTMGSQKAGYDWATLTQIPPVSGIIFAFICLTYFTIISRSICVAENGIILFYGCRIFLPHLLIHSSGSGHFATVNSAAVNLASMRPFKVWFSLDRHPRVELPNHLAGLFLDFKGTSILISIVTVTEFTFPTMA